MFLSRLLGSQCWYRLHGNIKLSCVENLIKSPAYKCQYQNVCRQVSGHPTTGCQGTVGLSSSQNLIQRFKNKEKMISMQAFHTNTHLRQFEDTKTRRLTLWSDLKQLRASPKLARTLAFSGLVPFVAAPAIMVSSQLYMCDVVFAQVAYGAAILSFLGGVRWGFSVADKEIVRPNWFGYSVTPPLIAWVGLMLPEPAALLILMGALAGTAYFDMAKYGYPPWFKGMRFVFSFVAILSLWATFMCTIMLPEGYKLSQRRKK